MGNIDPTSVTIVSNPTNGTLSISPTTGVATYTPNPGFHGVDTFEYQVCDDGNPLPVTCDEATVVINVNPVNDPPVATDDNPTTSNLTPVTTQVVNNDGDPNDNGNLDPTTVAIVTPPTNGTVIVDPITGDITYTPNPNFHGTDTYDYVICDDGNPAPVLCDTATVTVTILATPQATDDIDSTTAGQPTVIDVLANDNDPDGDNLVINTTPTSGPTNGSLIINPDGTYTYTPNGGFTGMDMFSYEVCDDGTPVVGSTATRICWRDIEAFCPVPPAGTTFE